MPSDTLARPEPTAEQPLPKGGSRSVELDDVWREVLESNQRGKRTHVIRWMVVFQFVAIFAVSAWWFGGGKYLLIPKRFGVVEDGRLYRSGQMSKGVVEDVLRAHQIGSVVRLTGNDDNDVDQQTEEQYAKRAGIICYQYPMCGDGTGEPEVIAQAIHRIHRELKSRKRVLVHCHAGSNRTGVVIGYYRLLLQGWSPEDVRAEMLHYEFDPERNPETIPFFNANARAVADLLFEKKVLKKRVGSIPKLDP